MKATEIIVEQGIDEQGQPEEFTWDLYPMVDSAEMQHLRDDGLPKDGTFIKQGMVVVGKRGKGSAFDATRSPSCLELHGVSREGLAAKCRGYWTNTSYYAPRDMGRVTGARFETRGGKLCAVVQIASEDEAASS